MRADELMVLEETMLREAWNYTKNENLELTPETRRERIKTAALCAQAGALLRTWRTGICVEEVGERRV